jgi:integrase
MAGIYLRGNRWWLKWYVNGEPFYAPTGLLAHEKAEAEKAKEKLERELQAQQAAKPDGSSITTVAGWRKKWIGDRRAQGLSSADDDEARLKHARALDPLDMADVRPRHIRELVFELKKRIGPEKGDLAPRTVRNIYGVLHRMFEDAVAEEVIIANPCVLKRGDLPPKRDKDPAWRSSAVYSRAEVERLLSDSTVPEERRTLYALLFLTGMRIGELAALRWSAYQPEEKPLGKLLVASSFNRKKREVKGTKTENPREVPVHPILAASLASWRLSGWARYMGRAPRPDDLLLPAYTGNHLRDPVVHANLLRDLEKLGMRNRRTHDTRRTFISLALADGARKDLLRWVTHGPPGDVIDLYTTLPWAALCEEVGRLNIRPYSAVTVQLQPVSASRKE